MAWELKEALDYYKRQGAPSDQTMLVNLLKEIQQECGGLTRQHLAEAAQALGVKESFLLAVVKRFPSLRLRDIHCLELCGGPNCAKRARLASFVRRTWGEHPDGFEVKLTGCMHQCGKGPNIKWDGKLYSGADEALLRRLIQQEP